MGDVALRAGVSAQTVSRVVNGSPRVDPATRLRVEEAMTALGYRVHRAARALRTGRTDTIGLIVSTLASVGNSRMLQAIADSAAARGFALMVVTATGTDAVADAFARLRAHGVDGAIMLNEATPLARLVEAPAGLALVVVDSARNDRYIVVQTAHAQAAHEATAWLLARGHHTVRHLGGPCDSYAASERERGWRTALEAAGAPVLPVLSGDWTALSGYEHARALPVETTALFAANDQMALGALRALAGAGRRVPEDVGVVGFDDLADAAQYVPPLTTMHQDFGVLAETAVEALAAAIGHAAVQPLTEIPARLVVRASA